LKQFCFSNGYVISKVFSDIASGISFEKRKEFFKKYNLETNKLVKDNIISSYIANFCYQSDCSGSINQDQAKEIYYKIKDYDDDICYGYLGRSDCAMFSDLKNIFKDCVENGDTIDWS